MIERIIAGFVIILIGICLIPEVSNQLYRGQTQIGWSVTETPKKQTYLDYVKERLEVERLMK